MSFSERIEVRVTKEIKIMLKELIENDNGDNFQDSISTVIRAAVIHYYSYRKNIILVEGHDG